MDQEISTSELEHQCGVSRHQLKRWTDAGLLLPPRLVPGPEGRGWRGMYPAGVIDIVGQIKEMSGRGVPLTKIARNLQAGVDLREARDREAEANAQATVDAWATTRAIPSELVPATMREIVRRQPKARLKDVYAAMVSTYVEALLGIPKELADRIGSGASDTPTLRETLRLAFLGYEPVLTFTAQSGVGVVPDFALGFLHSRNLLNYINQDASEPPNQPLGRISLLAGPALTIVWLCWRRATVLPPKWPKWMPALVVDELDREGQMMLRYRLRLSAADAKGHFAISVPMESMEPVPAPKELIDSVFEQMKSSVKGPRPRKKTPRG